MDVRKTVLIKKLIWASGWQGWQQKEDDLHVHVQVIFLFYGIEL